VSLRHNGRLQHAQPQRRGHSRGGIPEVAQGCIKLDVTNTTKVPCRLDEDPAAFVLLVVVVIVIEKPAEQIDYEDDDDDEDGSGKAQNGPSLLPISMRLMQPGGGAHSRAPQKQWKTAKKSSRPGHERIHTWQSVICIPEITAQPSTNEPPNSRSGLPLKGASSGRDFTCAQWSWWQPSAGSFSVYDLSIIGAANVFLRDQFHLSEQMLALPLPVPRWAVCSGRSSGPGCVMPSAGSAL